MNKRKLRIGIFIDHDIMIRHFIHSQVFLELSKKHKVDYFFPSVGHKRVTLDPTPYIKNARIFRLPENIIRKSIWSRKKHVDVMRGGFTKFARDTRRMYRLTIPRKVEIFHSILALPLIYEIYNLWTKYISNKNPHLLLQKILKDNKYDMIINPGIPNGLFINDLLIESKKEKIKFIFIMNSWDNPIYGKISSGIPDLYLVWGPQTLNFAKKYMCLPPEKVKEFGAAQFDIYKRKQKISKKKFYEKNNLDLKKRVILYAGGSLGTNEYEHLKILEKEIERGNYGNSVILYRPHPWGGGGNQGDRIIQEKWKHLVIENTMKSYMENIRIKGYHLTFPDYSDTHLALSYCDCIISPLSTILVEAAMHGKPVMCFLPLEDIQAKHFQAVHSLPHFRDFQNESEVILAKNREELKLKVKLLLEKVEDKSFSKRMKEISKKYVSNFKNSYSERLLKLVESF
tara:strand:- start:262 stop:1629 length:1368 start_codon:yes stop_codon:yes gene_type:complete